MSEEYIAVLFSGGLDSAVLLADAASRTRNVVPLYVSVGFAWEEEERRMIDRLLHAAPFDELRASRAGRGAPLAGRVLPVVHLRFDMRDVFPPTHWAVAGRAPAFDTSDEDVYIEGRNVILLAKAAVYMARHGIPRVLIGPLAGNPFPDATPAFFSAMANAMSLGLAAPIEIAAPFAALRKSQVIARGIELRVPLELTLSCMQPANGLHCGRCSKCRERRDAFSEAGVKDPTEYAVQPAR